MIEDQLVELMKKLDQLELREQFALLSRAEEQRQQVLGILLKHLGTSSSQSVQAGAAFLIGCHRLSEGAHALVDRIELEASNAPRRGPEPLWEQYPAMEALIAIGKPAEASVLEMLATESTPLRRDLGVKVIRYIEGAAGAEFILKNAQAQDPDAGRKAKFQDSLERLAKLPR